MNSEFKNRVYKLVSLNSKGKVATYGQIARLTGNPKASRAVGVLMKNNPFAPRVPCHRVVGYNGNLTGYSAKGGITRKKQLLLSEGVIFKGNQVDLTSSLWKYDLV